MAKHFPNGWVEVEIGQIADVVGGGTPRASAPDNFAEPGSGIAWLTPADLSGYQNKLIKSGARDLSEVGYRNCSARLMPVGAVLFSSRAPIGYVAVADGPISTNQGFKSFVFAEGVDPGFAYHYLKHIRPLAESMGTGTTFKELSGATAKKLPCLLLPQAEQKQITAKLDELLAQVDGIKARLDAIPAILERFRQSVLAAAVSGRLTEDWRGSNSYRKTEFGWEIPASWSLSRIDDVAEVKGGKRLPKGEQLVSEDTGYPYIRAGQLKGGTVNPDGQLYLPKETQEKISRYIVKSDDVYITIVGACIGDAGIIPAEYDGANLSSC